MAVEAKNVLVGAPDQAVTGAILRADLDTELPTSAVSPIDPGFKGSGYVSEEGLTLTPERSTTDIRDWSGAAVRRILEEFDGTLAWEYLEINEESMKAYFGDDQVTITAATVDSGRQMTARLGAFELPRKSWAFKMKDGKNRILIVVPDGQVTEQGEMSFVKSGAIKLPVVLTTYPDAQGNNIYIHTDDGVFAASAPDDPGDDE